MEILFVDNREITALNRQYLNHSGPTDVIAFGYEEDSRKEVSGTLMTARRSIDNPKSKIQNHVIVGSLVISAEMARSEAAHRGIKARDELVLYVTHGLLHLAGYDDATPALRRTMYRRERELITAAGYPYVR